MRWFDQFAIAFFGLTLLSSIINPNSKTATYLSLYAFAIIFMAIVLRNAVALFGWRDFLQKANVAGCISLSLVAIVEFFSRGMFGINPFGWLPFVNPPLAVCGFDVPRSYALSVEPTYLAWYLSTLGTVAIWYVWQLRVAYTLKLACAFAVTLALITTWSTSAMVSIPAAASLTLIYVAIFDRQKIVRWWSRAAAFFTSCAIIFVALCVILFATISSSSLEPCLNYVGMKPVAQALYGDRDIVKQIKKQHDILVARRMTAVSSGDTSELARIDAALAATNNSLAQLADHAHVENSLSRFQIWKRDLAKAIERPWFGWGPGYNSAQGNSSSLNFFIAVFLENGALALMSLVLFLLFVALHIARSAAPSKYVFLFAYAAGCLHMLTQTRFFFPYVWLLMGLFWLEDAAINSVGLADLSNRKSEDRR